MQLEEATGRRITELFDWIVGTSTGGIIALALVYGELFKECSNLRKSSPRPCIHRKCKSVVNSWLET